MSNPEKSLTKPQSNIRWTIVALLFFATTINYIDRQVIGLLKPFIQGDLHWDEADYGYIVTAFQIAYALGMIISGRLLDKFGTRIGYSMSIFVWSVGATLHSVMHSVFGFGVVRAVLGFGEAGNFPAAVKTIAEWFPKRDRALATGIFNAGSTIGAIVAPIIVAAVTISLGWRWAFIITGSLGIIWIVFWYLFYQSPLQHKRITASELSYIQSDHSREEETVDEKGMSWGKLLRHKQTYAICFSRFVTDWVWWFFLFWMPDFLNKTQHLDIKASVLPLILIYTMASFGGVLGGALSSGFIRAGRSIDYSRKTTILICALFVLPLIFVARIQNGWIAVILIGFAAAAHQGWASNIFTVVSDIYPRNTVGTMIGLSGFTGAIGGALSASFVGLLLKFTGSYTLIFITASSMYLVAWLTLKIFIPRIEELKLE